MARPQNRTASAETSGSHQQDPTAKASPALTVMDCLFVGIAQRNHGRALAALATAPAGYACLMTP